jgi:excisionase family DNA binding protein
MQYPIFLSPAEVARLLGMGKTFVYARISDGDFRVAKFSRSTRITFSSVIQYSQRCLTDGNGKGTIAEIFGEQGSVDACVIAEHFARLLCNTHSECTEDQLPLNLLQNPLAVSHDRATSTEKNSGGEL